jgi:hypothetical protein
LSFAVNICCPPIPILKKPHNNLRHSIVIQQIGALGCKGGPL